MTHKPKNIALQFNDCINNKDIEGLANLMTDNHTFIDSNNVCIHGKSANMDSWTKFFEMFPDYRNIFEVVSEKDTTIVMQGYVECSSEIFQNAKYLWTAEIEKDRVKEWRVYNEKTKK